VSGRLQAAAAIGSRTKGQGVRHPGATVPSHAPKEPLACAPVPIPYPSLGDISNCVHQHLLARGYVPFLRSLGQRYGYKAALFLGICLYWTRHSLRSCPDRQGWFHLSAHDIEQATTLSRHEQDSVRSMLLQAEVLEHCVSGSPPIAHYRLNLRQLTNSLTVLRSDADSLDRSAWFQGSVSFFRPLGDIAGSAAGGLLLSYLLRQLRKAIVADQTQDGRLQISVRDVERALCLTPKVQRLVKLRLSKAGMLSESAGGRLQLNLSAILNCVQGQNVPVLPGLGHSDGPCADRTGTFPARGWAATHPAAPAPQDNALGPRPMPQGHRIVLGRMFSMEEGASTRAVHRTPVPKSANAQTGKWNAVFCAQTGKLKVPKPANHIQTTNQKTTTTNSGAQLASLHPCGRPESLNAVTTQTPSRPPPSASAEAREVASNQALDALVWPVGLRAEFIKPVRQVLAATQPALRQALLDEFDGQVRLLNKSISNPPAWLLTVRQRYQHEGAVLSLAEHVASERTVVPHALAKSASRTQPPQSPPPDPQIRRKYLALLRGMRAEIASTRKAAL
jgi:hypothetical protein